MADHNPLAKWIPHLGRLGRATRWRRARGKPRVWAHRGDSANAPENTMKAFEQAVAVGADGLELDVRFDGGGNVIVFHDKSLDRLCGRPGLVGELTAGERTQLRVGGEPIPLLADVLDTFDIELDVEIKADKPGRTGALCEAVCNLLREHRRLDRIMVTSFDPITLVDVHRRLPDVSLGYIFSDDQALPLRRGWIGRWIGVSIVHPQHTLCTPETVKRWHTAGRPINAWTVDDPVEIRRMIELGIDGIFCNDPGAARTIVDAS